MGRSSTVRASTTASTIEDAPLVLDLMRSRAPTG